MRNVVQSDTGRSNVGRVESTNGPTHNKGTGCEKRSMVCCKYLSPINLQHYFRCWKFIQINGVLRFFKMGFQRVLGLGTWGKGSLESRIIWNLWLICRTKSWRNWTRKLNLLSHLVPKAEVGKYTWDKNQCHYTEGWRCPVPHKDHVETNTVMIGSLSFVCKAISPGRPFIRWLIDLTCGVVKS